MYSIKSQPILQPISTIYHPPFSNRQNHPFQPQLSATTNAIYPQQARVACAISQTFRLSSIHNGNAERVMLMELHEMM